MHLSEKTLDFSKIPFSDPQFFDVRDGRIGKSLYWIGNALEPNQNLVPFTGRIVKYAEIPEQMIRYVVRYDSDHYLVPNGIAMFANHSCDPNCRINDQFCIENIKTISTGDEITISYDQASLEDIQAWGNFWDPRWSFTCSCGARNCVNQLSGYRAIEDTRSFDAANGP